MGNVGPGGGVGGLPTPRELQGRVCVLAPLGRGQSPAPAVGGVGARSSPAVLEAAPALGSRHLPRSSGHISVLDFRLPLLFLRVHGTPLGSPG